MIELAFGEWSSLLVGLFLLAIPPLTTVHSAIWPGEAALALSHIALEASSVLRSVWPLHFSSAMHLTTVPLTVIHTTVSKPVGALSVHFVALELAFVDSCSRAGLVRADPVFAAEKELSLVLASVAPPLHSVPALFVLPELPLVGTPIIVDVLTLTMRPVVPPLSLVPVAVHCQELPRARRLTVCEAPYVLRSIGLNDDPLAVPYGAQPLTCVPRSALDLHLGTVLQLLTAIFG
eukprot:CAMPEP_0194508652 /NCGR_PEP_ID=MMETSP0253-20130528/39042_1 /TAXON_ID=2966 /ORGANISM="Noctiluca scintillans" /LENGTH=233 /DNA_ID=CAMNT_0039351719 /DNA_START=42 /DNA_END=744 /DNA_ORIENTATION=-